MLDTNYNWMRYWHPKGETIRLDGVGFPFDPGILNKNLVTFDTIAHNQCLILFGEPGIGKSTVLQSEYEMAEQVAAAAGNASMLRDLGAYSTDAALVHDIFEDRKFLEWDQGSHTLELFLDSLDECRLRVESIDALLLARLTRHDLSRLRLRISCRSADWTAILEKGLSKLWKKDAIAQYQLAPLGREHLRIAATEEGFDPDQFIRQVQQKHVTGLVIKPITLLMLLGIYRDHGTFPDHKTDLFLEGCKRLCKESNDSRISSGRVGSLKAEARLAIAARIAAASVFSNCGVISKRSDGRDHLPDVVTLNEIRGGREFVGDEFVEVTDAALIETLGTALFESSQDGDVMRWSHQTYAEFLAAWYLKQRKLGAERVTTLFVHPSDPEQRIVSQLHEVAANVAHIVPGALELILRHDPEVLVRSDMTTANAEEREAAVNALLKLYEEERAHEPWHLSINYSSLAHPNLAEQLRPYLVENHWNIEVRRLAISLAEDCAVRELQQELVDIALGDSQPMLVRVKAAGAVKEIGDSDTKQQLQPLVYKDDTDEYEDLRGFAFMAVWPEHMSADQLFEALTDAPDGMAGLYSRFLSSHLVPHLRPQHLPIALRWVMEKTSRHSPFKVQSLADEIILKGWEHLDQPEVLDALAEVILSRLRRYEDVLSRSRHAEEKEEFKNDPARRRRLLEAMLPKLTNPDTDWSLPPTIGLHYFQTVGR
jgi:DNA polymerase III delta prime subunit